MLTVVPSIKIFRKPKCNPFELKWKCFKCSYTFSKFHNPDKVFGIMALFSYTNIFFVFHSQTENITWCLTKTIIPAFFSRLILKSDANPMAVQCCDPIGSEYSDLIFAGGVYQQ